jgi:hypothetical protein
VLPIFLQFSFREILQCLWVKMSTRRQVLFFLWPSQDSFSMPRNFSGIFFWRLLSWWNLAREASGALGGRLMGDDSRGGAIVARPTPASESRTPGQPS